MTDNREPQLGVTVMPEWFQCEGIEPVLDRVQALGATAIATSPYVLETAPDGEGGREPPPDGEAGDVRPLDRAALRPHASCGCARRPRSCTIGARYAALRYRPSPPTALTHAHADLLDRVIEAAHDRGIDVLLQVMAASPPGYRVQFSGRWRRRPCLGPDGAPHDARVDRNGSLAIAAHRRATSRRWSAELAQRYPGVAGFRLDWPEVPALRLRERALRLPSGDARR